MNGKETSLILAGGGVILKTTEKGTRVAVIYRDRYGGEWGLPKGKAKKKESPLEAAGREAREETKFDVRITGFAGCTNYYHDDTPKVVFYWKMAYEGGEFRPSKEVQRLEWLAPSEAVKRLSHEDEKGMLADACSLEPTGKWPRWLQGVMKFFYRYSDSMSLTRLESTLSAYSPELQRRISEATSRGKDPLPWVQAAKIHMSEAGAAHDRGDRDTGWKCFHAANRMEIFSYDKEELGNKAAVLRCEAKKLSSWRQKATYELIGRPESTLEKEHAVLSPDSVYRATLLRDEHYNNQAYKGTLSRSHFNTLASLLAVSLFSVIYLAIRHPAVFASSGTEDLAPVLMLGSVSLFGLLGGVVSAVLTAINSNQSSRIPEMVMSTRVTFLRIFVGSASALVIYVFMKSGLTGFLDADIKKALSEANSYTYFAVSFSAGFTERLVRRAVGFVAGEK